LGGADTGSVRSFVVFAFLLIALAGCQSGSGTYDDEARDAAVRAVGDGPFDGVGDVSVGAVRERQECPQAASPDAGPCLAVDVTTKIEARTLEGDVDPLHRTVEASFDFFVWLKKDDQGRWIVTHSTYRPKGVPNEAG
jgi:hypothetical protein